MTEWEGDVAWWTLEVISGIVKRRARGTVGTVAGDSMSGTEAYEASG